MTQDTIIKFRAAKSFKEKLVEYAASRNMTYSDVCRLAIASFINNQD